MDECPSENFEKRHETEVDSLNVPYDYGSIMHYGLKDFSENNLPTLKVGWSSSEDMI